METQRLRPTPVHDGLTPVPPDLAGIAAHHSPGYVFWAVKHGIKLTGMPAWGETQLFALMAVHSQ